MADGRSFPVCLSPVMASRLAVNRDMLLNLECEHITLVSHSGIHSWTWNIQHLRSYGYKRDDFHFEAGTRCQTGTGNFCFYTGQGKEICHVLKNMKAGYKLRKCARSMSLAEKNSEHGVKKNKITARKFLSLLKRKPKVNKQDRSEEARKDKKERSSVVSAAYVTILPETPSVSNSASENMYRKPRNTRKRFEAGDAWKHHGY
ncbi:docking protein 1-like [Penaeus monodon]|uniref:docking protein 1-like n=1 Tax=Penaeus monodon TaxID=6687 RepID=UPI0018A746F2|nr:docking protein 1-like [Penaeus monodon]